jgi:pimeloyl-ACP methyl ester carboxylesterase
MFSLGAKSKPMVKLAAKIKKTISRDLLLKGLGIFNKHYYGIDKRNGVIFHSFKTMDLDATADIWNNLCRSNLVNDARNIKKQTLIIAGDHDEQIDVMKIQFLTKFIKGSRFKLLKGFNRTHALFLDCPEEMAGIVKQFLLF